MGVSTLLKIDVSPRGDRSISRTLGNEFAQQWKQAHSDGKIVERDLAETNLPFVDLPWIGAAFSDPSMHDEKHKAAIKISDDLIAELTVADEWLIATPMYNFAIPARLKAYIDHIVRAGKTFNVNSDGSYAGLIENTKVTVIVASTGDYTPGSPAESYDTETPYLKLILGFIGVTDVTFIQAGSTSAIDRGSAKREDYIAKLMPKVQAAAAAV